VIFWYKSIDLETLTQKITRNMMGLEGPQKDQFLEKEKNFIN
jgi:hypothetical protein